MNRLITLGFVFINFILQNGIWAQDYDFSAVAPSGQTLYYKLITDDTEVMVVRPPIGQKVSGNLIIPDSVEFWNVKRPVTVIDFFSFEGFSKLQSVSIPSSIISIKSKAFSNTGLTGIELPETVCLVGHEAFSRCQYLKKVHVKCKYANLGDAIFYDCNNIEEAFIDIDNDVSIPRNKLRKLVFGNNIVSIKQTFQNSNNLRMVVIGDRITNIPNNCFEDCDNLQTVVIGENVVDIGAKAFRKCVSLDTIIAKSTSIPSLDPTSFNFTPSSKIVITHCNLNYSSVWGTSGFIYVAADVHTLSLGVECSECGEASIVKDVDCNNTAIIKAIPSSNYIFRSWDDGNTDNPRTITLTQNTQIIALFEKRYHSVNVESDNITMGKVDYPQTCIIGESIIISALANCGYRFMQWSNGRKENPLSFTPICDTNLTAFFEVATDTVFVPDTNKKTVILYDTTVYPVIAYDTTINTVTLFDTTIVKVTVYDSVNVNVPVFDTVHITVPLFDTMSFSLKHSPLSAYKSPITLDTLYIQDTIMQKTGEKNVLSGKIYAGKGYIVLDGIRGEDVTVYNNEGRVVIDCKKIDKSPARFDLPISDVYIVKIGNSVVRSVVVIK